MKNKVLFLIGCGLLSTLPYNSTAQEKPAEETTRQIQQIAADIPTHPEEAAQQFHELLKGKNKKNVSLLVAVGNAYLAHNSLEEAQTYADKALKTEPRSAEACVLAGDIALARKRWEKPVDITNKPFCSMQTATKLTTNTHGPTSESIRPCRLKCLPN